MFSILIMNVISCAAKLSNYESTMSRNVFLQGIKLGIACSMEGNEYSSYCGRELEHGEEPPSHIWLYDSLPPCIYCTLREQHHCTNDLTNMTELNPHSEHEINPLYMLRVIAFTRKSISYIHTYCILTYIHTLTIIIPYLLLSARNNKSEPLPLII